MPERTRATDVDADHVLYAPSSVRNRQTVHLPDPDDPDQLQCDVTRYGGKPWKQKSTIFAPDSWTLCRRCDPAVEAKTGGASGTPLSKRLERADPEEVSGDA